jgi:AhpD family alkylhydroperoxidase
VIVSVHSKTARRTRELAERAQAKLDATKSSDA